MDELMREMGTMSVHCGESEYTQLDSAVRALGRDIPDHAALAAWCARLAVRYLEQIDNLSATDARARGATGGGKETRRGVRRRVGGPPADSPRFRPLR